MSKSIIRFGVIGGGLMAREFASAVARWCHLTHVAVRPEIVAVCDTAPQLFGWFKQNFPSIACTENYRELLARTDIDAIYCAVPHHLHADMYVDIIRAGKHLLGEKPFGIDAAANARILQAIRENPDVLVRCSSEFPYFPAVQRIINAAQNGGFGTILEVSAGLHHSSDMDPNKAINWKRKTQTNGLYGCMGDLGMHALHVPLRLGWLPLDVRAILSKVVAQRPGAGGQLEACDTWDNAILLCQAHNSTDGGERFPMTITTRRISPGDTNTWILKVHGTKLSMEFSSRSPKILRSMEYTPGSHQAWKEEDVGYTSLFPSITGHIFEFGFADAIQQMWAAFCLELSQGAAAVPFRCALPEETQISHELFTAALVSHAQNKVIPLGQ